MHAPRTADESLTNVDLAPVPFEKRTWTLWSYAALWISMAACIPTYMLASSLIERGMSWWQAVLTVFLGNVIVLIPMMLNAHAVKWLDGALVPDFLEGLYQQAWFVGFGLAFVLYLVFRKFSSTAVKL